MVGKLSEFASLKRGALVLVMLSEASLEKVSFPFHVVALYIFKLMFI